MKMNFFTKVALLAVVVALCVDAVAEAKRNRSNRKGRRGRKRNRVKIPDWLKHVTEMGQFGALRMQNKKITDATETVQLASDCTTFDLMKECKNLFYKKKLRYKPKKNQRGLRDILQRMTSFEDLLQQAKVCVNTHAGDKDEITRNILDATAATQQAITSFVKNVTDKCVQVDRRFKPLMTQASRKEKKTWSKKYNNIAKRRCKKHSKYNCKIPKQPCNSTDLQDHQETLKIVSTQLNNFLNRLISTEHIDVCTGKPLKRKKKGKSSPKKNRKGKEKKGRRKGKGNKNKKQSKKRSQRQRSTE